MKIHWQHILGFGGTLTLLAILIYAKPAFLVNTHSHSLATDATGRFDRNCYAMGDR